MYFLVTMRNGKIRRYELSAAGFSPIGKLAHPGLFAAKRVLTNAL